MWTPSDSPTAKLLAALSNGVACLYALVKQIDSGTPCPAVDCETWASALTALEGAMGDLRTDPVVARCSELTPEDVARVRLLRERLHDGEWSPELRSLAVASLAGLSGPDWAEKMQRAGRLAM